MQISTRKAQGVSVVDLDGKLMGAASAALYQSVQDLLARGVTKILINLDGVDLMDSSGLGELGHAHKAAASEGATIKLLHLGPNLRHTLDLAHLTGQFETFDDEGTALASFHS